MSKDKFDEYYLALTQGKNLEKRGLEAQALEAYLAITQQYLPDTDFAFERAVLLLEKKMDFARAKEVSQLALKRIKEDGVRGNPEFYLNRLEKIEEKIAIKARDQKDATTSGVPRYFRKNAFIAISLSYLVISVLLSLPNKIAKFSFLIFFAITGIFLVEVIKNLQKNIVVKWQTAVFSLCLLGTLLAASQVPPPEWTQFFSLDHFSGERISESQTNSASEAEDPSKSEITTGDLDMLSAMLDKDLIIADYQLTVDEKRLDLIVFLAPGATKDEAKSAVEDLFLELNAIKGYTSQNNSGDTLGDLYKSVSASIDVIDSFGQRLMRGQLNRANQRISWR